MTKKLNVEEKLITKQTYELNGKKLKQDPITILSKTSVNKKILGFPLKLMIYNLSNSNPAYALKVNGVFTAKLARIASYMGVKRFIYFSTVNLSSLSSAT